MALYHSVQGSVDYTVVGTPTIVDGVVSGFTTSDYISVPVTINQATDDWDFVLDITSNPTEISGGLFTFGAKFRLIYQGTSSSNRIRMNLRNAEDSENVWVQTPYFDHPFVGLVRVVKSGTTVSIYTKETTDTGWVEQASSSNLSLLNTSFSTLYYGVYSKPASTPFFKGSINLNNTYIKVNGQPWFGACPIEVKKHQIMGPVGYTVVGSPTITDGVVSGFSNSNKLTLPNNPAGNTLDGLEFHTKFKTTKANSFQSTFNWESYGGLGFIGLNPANKLSVSLGKPNSSSSTSINIFSDVTIEENVYYWVILKCNNGLAVLDYSIDGENYIRIGEAEYSGLNITNAFGIGSQKSTSSFGVFRGSIDFNETYIKVNGKLWFYQPAPTKYIIKDNSLVFASQDLYLSGPVNYEVVGTPTIVDGVASGFSSSDYVKLPVTSSTATTGYKVRIDFTTGSTVATQTLFYNSSSRFVVYTEATGKMAFVYTQNGSAKYPTISTNALAANTKYSFVAVHDGTDLTCTVTSNETVLDTKTYSAADLISFVNNSRFGVNLNGTQAFAGYIDFNQTYISVDGDLWFYGKNYASKNIAPIPAGYHTKGQVGCVAVGSPTIVDGVVMDPTSSNYITMNQTFDGTQDHELQYKFKFTESFTGSRALQLPSSGYYNAIDITGGQFIYYPGRNEANTSYVSFSCAYTFALNTDYWIRITKEGTTYKGYISTDGNSFTLLKEQTITDLVPSTSVTLCPTKQESGKTFPGSIDLNETYIKVNDELWFDGSSQYPFAGYVDMRTQVFTAAPSGATIGRDE